MEILKQFGLDPSICQDYQVKKKEYESTISEHKKKILLLEDHSYLGCLIVAICTLIGSFYSMGWFVLVVSSFLIYCIIKNLFNKKTHNFISGGKYYKLIEEKERLEQEWSRITEDVKNKVEDKEKALVDYCEKQIEKFKNEKLFRKQGGTKDFEASLTQYALIIERLSKLHEFLIFHRIYLYEHESYLEKRTKEQKEKKFIANELGWRSDKTKDVSDAKKGDQLPKKLIEIIIPPEIEYQKTKRVNLKSLLPGYIGRKIDWKELSESQRLIGERGEELVVELEKESLRKRGRSDLAGKVLRMSKEKGDGLGYDVLSFYIGGREKYIEVKSTTVSLESSFYISRNELLFLETHRDDSFVYRVLLTKDIEEYSLLVITANDFLSTSERTPVMFKVQI